MGTTHKRISGREFDKFCEFVGNGDFGFVAERFLEIVKVSRDGEEMVRRIDVQRFGRIH